MTAKQWTQLALAATAALLGASQAHASLHAQALIMDAQGMYQNTGGPGNAQAALDYAEGGRISRQSATAGYGVLKTFSSSASTEVQGLSGSAIAGWSDSITFNHAALAGTQGTLRLNFSYTYALAASTEKLGVAAQGYFLNTVSVSALGGGDYDASTHRQIDSYDGTSTLSGYGSVKDYAGVHPSSDTQISMLVDFVWGQPIQITQFASTQCGVGFFEGVPGASCTADASHSSYWGGVTDVMSGGVAVTDFTMSSTSGTDYSMSFVPQPVPEPAQVWLLAGGMLAGALSLRRRKATLHK